MYYFCQFRGYPIVVHASSKESALEALIVYVRETKGNIAYSDREIKENATVKRCLDFVDAMGYIKSLSQLSNEISKMKADFSIRLRELETKHSRVINSLREIYDLFDEGENDYSY